MIPVCNSMCNKFISNGLVTSTCKEEISSTKDIDIPYFHVLRSHIVETTIKCEEEIATFGNCSVRFFD